MYKSLLLLLASLFLHLAVVSQKVGPSIEEIAARFYNTYECSSPNLFFNFENRAGQWRVSLKIPVENSINFPMGSYLFFDADSGGFKKLPFPLKRDTIQVDFRQYLDSYLLSNFHIHEYYGYNGWYKDVISALSGKERLSDSALYSLACAYCRYASCMVTDQSDDDSKNDLFNMPMTRNCMSAAQREKYHQIESKAIFTFSRLSQQNPNLETLVGKIPVKYANEVMEEFHTYLTYFDNFAASYSLPDHLYPDTVVAKMRRVLEKCPENAILLSLGDNDFYPVLYIQQKLGVRKDVYLIHRHLIGVDRFIYMANKPQFQSKPLQLSVKYEQYKGTTNDYILLGHRSSPMPFTEVIDTILKGHLNEYNALTLPSNEFIIKRAPQNANNRNETTILFQETTPYILKEDWILLDILNNLNGRRLVCVNRLDGSLAPLNQYFVQKDDDLFVY
jgi:hypothetical protein